MQSPKGAKAATTQNGCKGEVTALQLKQYAKYKSWKEENHVFEFIDMRKYKVKNYVTGRWVLTIKRDKDGNFLKPKARWVLRGFLDRQGQVIQTDSPTATRPGFRLACQVAVTTAGTCVTLI